MRFSLSRSIEDGGRRDLVRLVILLTLLAIGALWPALAALIDSDRAFEVDTVAAPLPIAMAAIVAVAAFGFRLVQLESSYRTLSREREVDNHASLHDPLTGAANRRQFEQRLSELAADGAPSHALLMIDLDRFKPVNDLYGHAAGDALLQDISAGLARLVGPKDLVARLGGDEFAMLLVNTTGAATTRIALAALDFVTRYRLNWEGQRVGVGTSIGVIGIDRPGLLPAGLLAAADEALYAAKEAGRGAVFAVDQPNGAVGGEPSLRRLDEGRPEPVSSARSHEPEDGRHQQLYAVVMACLPDGSEDRNETRQGSRRRHEITHWLAVEPQTVGDANSPGLVARELIDDASARADGGADLARWTLGMALEAASRHNPTVLGRIGFSMPLPARAVVAVPGLADELLRMNALAYRPIKHLAFVLHGVGPLYDEPSLVRFHQRLHESDVRLGFEIRASTLDVLAPLRHVPYDELHLGRELVHNLRPGGGGAAAIETLIAIAERSGTTLVASGVDSPDTLRHLAMSGVNRFSGPIVGNPEQLHDVLDRLKDSVRMEPGEW